MDEEDARPQASSQEIQGKQEDRPSSLPRALRQEQGEKEEDEGKEEEERE